MVFHSFIQGDFLSEQKKYARVKAAIKEKEQKVKAVLKEKHVTIDNLHILIVVYKDNDELELYAKRKDEKAYTELTTYQICSRSGQPGPKRRQGDNQVPEGFYHIERFNPESNYYLSLGINYPNQSDKKKSEAIDPGGDIYIHGSCVTIGCMPVTDDKIKEIYLYAVYAKNNGQEKIPVYIFPFRMTNQNFIRYTGKYKNNKELIAFWTNLKIGYDMFNLDKKELDFNINSTGDYVF